MGVHTAGQTSVALDIVMVIGIRFLWAGLADTL
jgi:hypothetical protein